MLNLLLLLLAGAFSGLALPPIGQWWVLALTLPVLLHAMEKATWHWSAFFSGTSFGLGYFIAAFHWIGFAFLVDVEAYLWMMPFAVGGLALMMAVYWGAAMLAAYAIPTLWLPRVVSVTVCLAIVEYLRGHLFTGFPWAAPGLVTEQMGGVLQAASLVGMPALTLLVLLWAAVPYALWAEWRGSKLRLTVFVAAGLTLPAFFLWGEWRLQNYDTVLVPDFHVRLVQPNVSQSDKWRSDNADAMLTTLTTLSSAPAAELPDLIIWPEASVPFLLDEEPEALRRIDDALSDTQTLLAGSLRRELRTVGAEPFFTSILQIDGAGTVQARYDKWRLVPGGEYLPLEWLLEPLGFRKVVSLPESLSAGGGPRNLDIPSVGLATMLICYEAIFPHFLVPDERPRFIVNVTNDGWFGNSAGPYQHLAQVRMRAVEQGLPVLRAANTGISAVFDPFGRALKQNELGVQVVIDSALPEAVPATPYARWGDWFLLLMLAVFCAPFIWVRLLT